MSAVLKLVPSGAPFSYEGAAAILGTDFVPPSDLQYSPSVAELLATTLPENATLEAYKRENIMLVAGPPKALGVHGVRKIYRAFFVTTAVGWYARPEETFAHQDLVEPGWLAFPKQVPKVGYQHPLARPNAAQAVWCFCRYRAINGTLPDAFMVTSSVDSNGYPVRISGWDRPKKSPFQVCGPLIRLSTM